MLPMAVLAPTPTTIALALPATTAVPWQSKYIGTCLMLINTKSRKVKYEALKKETDKKEKDFPS